MQTQYFLKLPTSELVDQAKELFDLIFPQTTEEEYATGKQAEIWEVTQHSTDAPFLREQASFVQSHKVSEQVLYADEEVIIECGGRNWRFVFRDAYRVQIRSNNGDVLCLRFEQCPWLKPNGGSITDLEEIYAEDFQEFFGVLLDGEHDTSLRCFLEALGLDPARSPGLVIRPKRSLPKS